MKKLWNSVNWLIVAGLFTVAYLVIFLWWIGYDRIARYPTNNSLNEVGDFIAGFFSPLAFIWLVAAVLTQRQELTDTRDQFAENQKVVDAQLTTINEQSDLLRHQHLLAEETARKTYRLSLFEQRFAIYNELVLLHQRVETSGVTSGLWNDLRTISTKASFVFGEDLNHYLDELIQKLVEYFADEEKYRSALESGQYVIGTHLTDEQVKAKNLEASNRLAIASSLEPETLKRIMWKFMYVSDC